MAIHDIIMAAAGASSGTAVYVEDVFSTYLYTGNGSSQTITNGIDLSTKGGLVWLKSRTESSNHQIFDTARGVNQSLQSNYNGGQTNLGPSGSYSPYGAVGQFNTDGFNINGPGYTSNFVNSSGATYASWTFRKQAKFFDIVTWTGNGTNNRTISHSLGCIPGMVIYKKTNTTSSWYVWHKSLSSATDNFLVLNTTIATDSSAGLFNAPTSTTIGLGSAGVLNGSGDTWVAYLFADSNSGGFGSAGTDSVVACGSFTASSTTTAVTLGWEPQYILFKRADTTQSWFVWDTMRGMALTGGKSISPNLSDAEGDWSGTSYIYPTATGFVGSSSFFGSGANVIYLAIRRGPMKTPTDATKVFAPVTRTGDGFQSTGFPVDLLMADSRGTSSSYPSAATRLTGPNYLNTYSTGTESAGGGGNPTYFNFTSNTGVTTASFFGTGNIVGWNFQRAPGFFDVVCATATGSAFTVSHNLGVAPELVIWRNRDTGGDWNVYHSAVGNGKALFLNYNWVPDTDSRYWNATSPTASVFSIGSVLATSGTYVAYLFATCPGVSKVGSYTGSGTTKQIDCGFTSGARFVLIKRTDSTGDWYVWDTARGIVSANDPYLLLNSTAAEVTNTDYIDPYSAGFEISSSAPAAINASGGTFIYLAIA